MQAALLLPEDTADVFDVSHRMDETNNQILAAIRYLVPSADIECGPWIAGGAVRRLVEGETFLHTLGGADIDVFFPNDASYDWASQFVKRTKANFGLPFHMMKETTVGPKTGTGITFEVRSPEGTCFNLQFLKKKFFTSPLQLFDDFDFTICMFATDGHVAVAEERAEHDLDNRKLVIHKKPPKPKAARFAKYLAYGFEPGEGVLRAMMGVDTEHASLTDDLCCDEY